ncbi:MAG: hypothetical protein BGO25_10335 [Acidobacteriales bacterium 59-55]|nr:hypothetical protein [Terriglobales bacterium]OJV43581.1 MAG: hypothetical protein BGO25_10335 [Acidobacteriales bacterium 59-55]
MRKKARTRPKTALEELRALERKPPTRANLLIARHLKCDESLKLSYAVVQAAQDSSRGSRPLLRVPSEFLPPLI